QISLRALPAGAYVLTAKSTQSVFILGQAAGTTASTAQNLGKLGVSTVTATGWVGNSDPTAYYEFSLASAQTVTFSDKAAVAGEVTLPLTDSQGHSLATSAGGAVVKKALSAGAYYV